MPRPQTRAAGATFFERTWPPTCGDGCVCGCSGVFTLGGHVAHFLAAAAAATAKSAAAAAFQRGHPCRGNEMNNARIAKFKENNRNFF